MNNSNFFLDIIGHGLSSICKLRLYLAVPSPVEDVKIVSPISTFVLNTLTLKEVRYVQR